MRKLATSALAYTSAVLLAKYLLPLGWLPACALALLVLAGLSLLLRGNVRLRMLLLTLSAAVGLFWTWGHYQLTISPAHSIAGQAMTVTARAEAYPEAYDGYSRLEVRLLDESLPDVRTLLYLYDGEMPELCPGDLLTVTVTFDTVLDDDGEELDGFTSRGVFLRGYMDAPPQYTGRASLAFLYFPQTIARAIGHAADACFPERVSGFMKALLAGDRTDFYADGTLRYDMGRAGFLHIVAISGMHVAFLLGFVRLITGRRRLTAAVGIPLVLIFIPMTGGNPSVIRAGFMQIALLTAPLLRRENDSVTSLSAVLALLLIINPQAGTNAGLQLSFASMAGILLIAPQVYAGLRRLVGGKKCERRLCGVLNYVLAGVSSSVGALVFSTPLAALHFGYVPLYSVLTNVLCLWAMSFCFTAGYLVCFAGMLLPELGSVLAFPVTLLVRYVMAVVHFVSGLPFAAVYTENNLAAWWLAASYTVFLLCFLLRGKQKFRPFLPTCMSITLFCVMLLLTMYGAGSATGVIHVLDVGQGQCIVVFCGTDTVVIDCGSAGDPDGAADVATEFLLGQGRDTVDLLIVTHFHADHANGITTLFDRLEIRRLAAPEEAREQGSAADEVLSAAEAHGAELICVTEDLTVGAGVLELRLYAPTGGAQTNERGVVILADFGDFEALITGDVNSIAERTLLDRHALPDIELLVVGHHGAKDSTDELLLRRTQPELAVLSVGENNYGHPSAETMERLEACGLEIYRTDLCGNVTVRVG